MTTTKQSGVATLNTRQNVLYFYYLFFFFRSVLYIMKVHKVRLEEPEANLISLDFCFASASFTMYLEQKPSLASTV